jgi:hypothetical protein
VARHGMARRGAAGRGVAGNLNNGQTNDIHHFSRSKAMTDYHSRPELSRWNADYFVIECWAEPVR